MRTARAWTRLAMLAVGLGIGGALAATPGMASADSSSDWLSAVDSLLGGGALSAADTTPALNLAISFDGITLFQDGTAYAHSGTNGDIAIANGAGANAYAFGTDNYASVDGTGSTAVAGATSDTMAGTSADNTAFVFGNDSYGWAGTTDATNPGSFNYAVIFGNNDTGWAGGDAAGSGSYDGSYSEGNDLATAYAQGSDHLVDIVKFYGDSGSTTSTTAAAESTNLMATTDPTGALGDGQAFWADVASAFDGTGTAADFSNLWTELTTLF